MFRPATNRHECPRKTGRHNADRRELAGMISRPLVLDGGKFETNTIGVNVRRDSWDGQLGGLRGLERLPSQFAKGSNLAPACRH